MSYVLVIYHHPCVDGFAAAWAFRHNPILPGDFYYYKGVHSEAPPEVEDMRVFLLDFSYDRKTVEQMLKKAVSITVIDHHMAAVNALKEINNPKLSIYSDINRSGAMLTWDFTNRYKCKTPEFLHYIQDHDLWKHELPNSKEICAWIYAQPRTVESYNEMSKADLQSVIPMGKCILQKIERDAEALIESGVRTCKIGGYEVPVVNAPYFLASEVAGKLAETHVFAATYYDSKNGKRVYSLRSRGNFDVSAIARLYGGNGHFNASGFSVNMGHVFELTIPHEMGNSETLNSCF